MPLTSRVFQVRHTWGTKEEVVKPVATSPRMSMVLMASSLMSIWYLFGILYRLVSQDNPPASQNTSPLYHLSI